jgi:hypothetical protein
MRKPAINGLAVVLIGLLTLGLTACSTVQPTSEWRQEGFSGGPFRNLFIIGASEDTEERRLFEESFVAALEAKGVQALASINLMAVDAEFTEDEVDKVIRGKDIDGVILTRVVGVEEQIVYYPPRFYIDQSVVFPGRTATYENVKLESSLFETGGGTQVWAMQAETLNSRNAETIINDTIKRLVDGLSRQKLI